MTPSRCTSCEAAIYWVELNGKPHPVNVAPTPNGTIVLRATVQDGQIVALYGRMVALTEPIGIGEQRRTSHFSSCPNAQAHRRPRWRPCGYPGCSPTYCDDCDGKGYQPQRRR